MRNSMRALVTGLFAATLLALAPGESDAAPKRKRKKRYEIVATTPAQGAQQVAPQTLAVSIELDAPLGAATDLDSLLTATVAGTPVPLAASLSSDARTIHVQIGGALPAGAEIVVGLGRDLRNEKGRKSLLRPNPALNPLRFRMAPSEIVLPPAPQTDPGRLLPAAVVLADGTIFVAGGLGTAGTVRADSETGTAGTAPFTALAASMTTARWNAPGARLADGRVVIAGGFTAADGKTATSSVEVFDPAKGTFTAAGALASARGGVTLVRTVDGVVVVAGGTATWNGPAATNSVQAFNPFSGAFANLAEQLPAAVTDMAASPLPGGRVLLAGGANGAGAVVGTASLVDPVSETASLTVEPTGALVTPRRGAAAALVASGQVIVAGGEDASGAKLATIEAYDTVAGTFRLLPGTLSAPRSHASVVVLANGAVAVVGGVVDSGGNGSPVVDVIDPLSGERVASYVTPYPVAGGAAFALADGSLFLGYGAPTAALPPASRSSKLVLTEAALGINFAGPRIIAVAPQAAASQVDPDAVVTVTFSRPVAAASLAGAVSLTDGEGVAVPGTTVAGSAPNVAVFTPSRPLPPNQTMSVEVAATVADLLGRAIADDGTRKWTFSTAFDVEIGAADDASQFGYSVNAGDVNGDGIDDIVVSAYNAESTPGAGTAEGQVYVVFGRADRGPASPPLQRDLAAAAEAADLTITAETAGDQPGIESALGVADVNGDGYDDVIIGAHNGDGPTEAGANQGELFVVFGQSSYPVTTLKLGKAAVAGFNVLKVYGESVGDRFGEGMGFGDVDGDGFTDIVCGATAVDLTPGAPAAQRDYGAVYCIFGGSLQALGVVNGFGSDTVGPNAATLSNVRLLGIDASDRVGWSAACADIDGDGFAEIMGGATGADGLGNGKSSAGEVVGLFGAARSSLIPTGRYAAYQAGPSMSRAGFVVHGEDASDFMAWALATGDLDHDGFADLAIGGTLSSGIGNVGNNRGEVSVVFGAARSVWVPSGNFGVISLASALTSPRLLRIHGQDDGDTFGDCMEIADADGDGARDLVVGGYGGSGLGNAVGASTGEFTVFRGTGLRPAIGVAVEFALTSDATALPANVTATRFFGKGKADRYGTSVRVCDFNADGRPDIVTGANKGRGLGRIFSNAGEAYLFWGRSAWWR